VEPFTEFLSFRTTNGSTTVTGIAYNTEQTIQVNFFWLIFPIVLFLMISSFFFLTIFKTRDLPPWKSSALALLWCEETGDNKLSTLEQMKARGKQANVNLLKENDSWRLAET
jgi:hypothetical protein